MISIELGNDDRLYVQAVQHMLRLYPGVGGAHISLRFEVSRQSDAPTASPFKVSALLYLCGTSGQDQKLLGALEVEQPVSPQVRSSQLELVGFVSDEQLRVIEELRRGDDVHLYANVTVTSVVGDPPILHVKSGGGRFHIGVGEWLKQLEQVDAGTFIEVLVPMVGGADFAIATEELRKARTLLRQNNIEAALLGARKALEPIRKAERTAAIQRKTLERERANPERLVEEKRTLPERFAFIVEDLARALSGAMHKDPVTKTFEYTRGDAVMLVAATAGVLVRVAEQRRWSSTAEG
ncbi:hypothetical protein ACIBPB_27330 [Micromonospora sp. NPDC049836]|uniref:hypothetical protein n=1 Tax=Micromonospora sp. NPDC049836 TaxID=3364274 RepID=UPI003791A0B4